jgi:hypothetical protein
VLADGIPSLVSMVFITNISPNSTSEPIPARPWDIHRGWPISMSGYRFAEYDDCSFGGVACVLGRGGLFLIVCLGWGLGLMPENEVEACW